MAEAIGRRVVSDLEIPCPAGEPVGESLGGSGCHCHIEGTLITSAIDPSSLGRFCTAPDGYLRCPTWQAETHRIERGVRTRLAEMEHPEVIEALKWAERERELIEQYGAVSYGSSWSADE